MANLMTLFRILITIPLVLAIIREQFEIAFLFALAGIISDAVDGKLARLNGEGNPLGKLLDPLADKIFVLSSLIALVEVGRIGSFPVILLLLRELGVTFLRSFAASQGFIISASLLGKVKTFLEFSAVLLLIPGVEMGSYLLWSAVAVAYVSVYDYARSYLDNYVCENGSESEAFKEAYIYASSYNPEEGRGLTLVGPPGVGKTHLAVGVLKKIRQRAPLRLAEGGHLLHNLLQIQQPEKHHNNDELLPDR